VIDEELPDDPVRAFERWLGLAVEAGLPEPTAMTLATSTREGRVSARIVLLKQVDARGFVFATNYQSRKAREIEANPWVCLVFGWIPLERQVRIEGLIERTSEEESDAIFAARPRAAQLGAWASTQSEVIPSRAALEAAVAEADRRFPATVPRPPHWGGYRVVPHAIELWRGRPHRLHDRLRYERAPGAGWTRRRLAP
jgi:pyridoxamine 5'-phosphate oxidase